ncbi:MAG: 30S ribosomal protein S3 [Gammaproteobacteria bacterium]
MGQKANPKGLRIGIVHESASTWYTANKTNFRENLLEDIALREVINAKYPDISEILIKRPTKKSAIVNILTSRPAAIIGKSGAEVEVLRKLASDILKVPAHVNIVDLPKPHLDARLVAKGVAQQLEQRVMFRRAMKRAVTNTLKAGAEGIKICISGRLGGAEIARSEWYREGRVPLHTLRANIDYAISEAKTTYGIIGVKVWIFKGEVFDTKQDKPVIEEAIGS